MRLYLCRLQILLTLFFGLLFSTISCQKQDVFKPEKNRQIEMGMGYLVGEVNTTSAILQSRLTHGSKLTGIEGKTERLYGKLPGHQGVARFEISKQEDFEQSYLTDWLRADTEDDFIVKVKVDHLEPDTSYYYRLVYGVDQSATRQGSVGTFKTLADKESYSSRTIAIISCMNYDWFHNPQWRIYDPKAQHHLGYETFKKLERMAPDYLISTGDNVYYDKMPNNIAKSRGELRTKYHEQFSQPRLVKFLSKAGSYWQKDDHDYRVNDSDPSGDYAPSHQLGIDMFREQLPVVDPEEKNAKTYRTYRINKTIQVWLVEGRDYRSPNEMEDSQTKSIWGQKQKQWLKSSLLESDATFKVLITPTPMVGPDSEGKGDNHANLKGFRHERDSFFAWLVENQLDQNFYIVTGDRHWRYHAVDLATGIEEFSVGTVDASSTHYGNGKKPKPEDKVEHLYHQSKQTGGFLLLKTLPPKDNTGEGLEYTFYHQNGQRVYQVIKTLKN